MHVCKGGPNFRKGGPNFLGNMALGRPNFLGNMALGRPNFLGNLARGGQIFGGAKFPVTPAPDVYAAQELMNDTKLHIFITEHKTIHTVVNNTH